MPGAAFDFDPPVVSYWAQWLGHPRPRLLIVGQDFGDAGYFERHRGSDDPKSQTNANLHRLLTEAGFTPGLPPSPDPVTPVYLTNAVLCLKRGAMNAPVPARWVRACATAHLRWLIEALAPAAVVIMGSNGWAPCGLHSASRKRRPISTTAAGASMSKRTAAKWLRCRLDR